MSTPTLPRMPVALIGAGAIGRMHAERCAAHPEVRLAAVADPTEAGRTLAAAHGVPWYADHRALLDAAPALGLRPGAGAAIVASPNATHRAVGVDCVAAGLALLVEKPIADSVEAAEALCAAAEAQGVPLLVAHHRRHNPITQAARELVAAGALGTPVVANVMACWLKPDAYFELAWRRQPGGGPVLINLIHDIDQLRHVLGPAGEVVEVQAMASTARRGFTVEDSAAVLLRLAGGALATMLTTDAAVGPFNWDLAAGEAAHYPQQAVDAACYSGTAGTLTLPRLELWRHDGARGWHERLTALRSTPHRRDPYAEQLTHLRAVAERRAEPLCGGRDALRSLHVALAVLESAATRRPVSLPD